MANDMNSLEIYTKAEAQRYYDSKVYLITVYHADSDMTTLRWTSFNRESWMYTSVAADIKEIFDFIYDKLYGGHHV